MVFITVGSDSVVFPVTSLTFVFTTYSVSDIKPVIVLRFLHSLHVKPPSAENAYSIVDKSKFSSVCLQIIVSVVPVDTASGALDVGGLISTITLIFFEIVEPVISVTSNVIMVFPSDLDLTIYVSSSISAIEIISQLEILYFNLTPESSTGLYEIFIFSTSSISSKIINSGFTLTSSKVCDNTLVSVPSPLSIV